MRALVVYESMFGNTEEVARAIAHGLSLHGDVSLVDAVHAPAAPDEDLDLIVVGGPTHAFAMSRPSTRQDAVGRGASPADATLGIREWLEHLSPGPDPSLVVTFDTRAKQVRRLPGSAAKSAARVAHRHGYDTAARPESFYVADTTGPLLDGELEHAREWGEALGVQMQDRVDAEAT